MKILNFHKKTFTIFKILSSSWEHLNIPAGTLPGPATEETLNPENFLRTALVANMTCSAVIM